MTSVYQADIITVSVHVLVVYVITMMVYLIDTAISFLRGTLDIKCHKHHKQSQTRLLIIYTTF